MQLEEEMDWKCSEWRGGAGDREKEPEEKSKVRGRGREERH